MTALLIALPVIDSHRREITIEVDGELISKPYIDMTLRLMGALASPLSELDGVVSPFQQVPARVKETARIAAIADGLRKAGATVEEGDDYVVVMPPARLKSNAAIDTYDDH
jgi:3-phosphoshikimate 1-carboxyvinyltransferase